MIKKSATAAAAAEQRVVLYDVSWDTYVALNDESDSPGCRLTYDNGVLEIMNTSLSHENVGCLLARMVEQFTLVRNIEIRSVKSTTFRRKDLKRGFEGDESYYIGNAVRMRGLAKVDLSVDPPPDLVIEIEITCSAIDKLALFATLGIPEVWRYDQLELWIGTLVDQQYRHVAASVVLPGFPVSCATELLSRLEENETALIREFAGRLN